ncbi:MAG: hypothetical protein BroJett018_52980 [Chloroflexota bacterium]|nr:MAG: hypothetical protein BroJett018_52980 [Chloroflexota bacterium]
MDTLTDIVKRELAWYAASGFNSKSYLLMNDATQTYAVNVIFRKSTRPFPTNVVMMVRVIGDYVIVEDDRTDKPFEDRLMAAGIPREKIILAYAGESLPDLQQG